jgi:hypothetical protein
MLRSLLKNVGRRGTPAAAPAAPQAGGASALPPLTQQRGGTILAFTGQSEGDALGQILLEILRPLRAQCHDAVLLNLNDRQFAAKLAEAARHPVWFAISFFGVGEHFAPDGHNPWLPAGIPFVRLFGDLPAYHPRAHVQHWPNAINAYGHAEHHEFFVRWYARKAPSVTLPGYPFDSLPREKVDVQRKMASGRLLFPKNGNCPDRLITYWREQLPPALAQVLEAVSESASATIDEPIDLHQCMQGELRRAGIELPGDQQPMFFLAAQVDDYLRRKKSTLIARSLLDLPVVIRGINWDHVDFSGRRARHDPDSDFARTRQILDESLGVIDMAPNTQRGPHDRIFRAAGRHTAFLTNRQRFFVDNFENHASFLFAFDADSIRQRMETALRHPRDTVEMGLAQAERMRQLMSEEEYYRRLILAVDACALGCARPPGTQPFVVF